MKYLFIAFTPKSTLNRIGPVRVPSMYQIDLFKNDYSRPNCSCKELIVRAIIINQGLFVVVVVVVVVETILLCANK